MRRRHAKEFADAGLTTYMSFDELSKVFGVSRARVMQICHSALDKLTRGLAPIAREYFDDDSLAGSSRIIADPVPLCPETFEPTHGGVL
jgi:hypothetical protein